MIHDCSNISKPTVHEIKKYLKEFGGSVSFFI